MTIWMESSRSDSQELNTIKDTPLDLIHGQFKITVISVFMTKLELSDPVIVLDQVQLQAVRVAGLHPDSHGHLEIIENYSHYHP